jgi:serine/threonine-protein kinase
MSDRFAGLIRELRHRRVFRVAAAYLAMGLGVIYAGDAVLPRLGFDGAQTVLTVLVTLGFPLALALAWAFDVTPEGMERTRPAAADDLKDASGAHRPSKIRSIAVLPFANMCDGPESEYLSDGIAEEIINVLVNRSDLRVTARTSSFAFKGREDDVRLIGAKLGVGAVLEGSVRRSGSRLRITTQLIDVADGFHLWSERFDSEMTEVFAVQDEIAASVVRRLSIGTVTSQSGTQRSRPADMAAYDAYLRGRFHWNHHTPQGYAQALACYEEAVLLEPDYAAAHAGMAACWFWMGFIGSRLPDAVYPKAKADAERALTLDPSLAEAHAYRASVAMVYEWDWQKAEEGLRKAVALDPGSTTVRQIYTVFLFNLGWISEAEAQNLEILRIDPLWVKARQDRGSILSAAGRYEEAVREVMKALELDPHFPVAHYVLGISYLGLGRYDAAVESLEASVKYGEGASFFRASLATALAYSGRKAEAEAILAAMMASKPRDYVPAVLFSWIHIALGDFDTAFGCLEEALAERSAMLLSAPSFSFFDPVRWDPRFAQLLDRMGLTGRTRPPERELWRSPYAGAPPG